jgi:hypothetical protein
MRIEEIMYLRDAGAGEIITQDEFPIGLGSYTLRFTLSDGRTVDLQTNYPPAPRTDREAIFLETRALKKQLKFFVQNASRNNSNPKAAVWGILQYKLADGRTVGISERVPTEVISSDGRNVTNTETEGQTNSTTP